MHSLNEHRQSSATAMVIAVEPKHPTFSCLELELNSTPTVSNNDNKQTNKRKKRKQNNVL
jgi:hypothetical protein